MTNPIQSLWIGSALSTMERLCLSSFLAHGHEFHLYTYGPVEGIPAGVTLMNAADILPPERIFTYSNGSPSAFSNLWRYKLLLDRGGWWVDMDVIALQPFDFERSYVFGCERTPNGRDLVNCGVIRVPPRSGLMTLLVEECESKDPSKLVWGETGPQLMNALVRLLKYNRSVEPVDTFYPVDWWDWRRAIDPAGVVIPPSTRAVHLWQEGWRASKQDKDASYDPGCLYERLKKRFEGRGNQPPTLPLIVRPGRF